jgi:hypothetical protein
MTKIILSRTNPTTGSPFYFINVYNKDNIGFTLSQFSAMISEAQYLSMKGVTEEVYQAEGNLYVVNLA